MKRIALSLGIIALAGGAAFGATGAFFSDTQTSSGNTFSAGSLVLTVDDTAHYAGLVCVANDAGPGHHWIQDTIIGPNPTTRPDLLGTPCDGTWLPGPLGPSTHFFNYGDVKPGDQGENTISLHVTNSAWACLNIHTDANNENGVNGPELAAGDNPALNGPQDGELAQNISVFAWSDSASTTQGPKAGDNIFEPNLGETALFGGTGIVTLSSFGGTTTIPLADSTHGSPLIASTTNYIGIAWCLGSTTVDGATGAITCDGGPVTNIVQTDSATSSVQFNVVQWRNNPRFLCNPNNTPPPPPGGLVVTKLVTGTTSIAASAFTLHVKTLGNADALPTQPGPVASFSGLVAGTYIVTEDGPPGFNATFSAGCSATTTPFSGGAVAVVASATSSCTITNNDPGVLPGNLTVIKHVVHLGAPDAAIAASDFVIHVKNAVNADVAGSPHAGVESPGFTFTGLVPGTYSIIESGPITVSGEHVVASYTGNCSDITHTVAISSNATSTCTITNTYAAGT